MKTATSVMVLAMPLVVGLQMPGAVLCARDAEVASEQQLALESVEPTIFFREGTDGLRQAVDVTVQNRGPATRADLAARCGSEETVCDLGTVAPGETRRRVYVPDVRRELSVEFVLRSGAQQQDRRVVDWRPRRHWEVYLVHLSHHDVGYTDLPSQVLRLHASFFDSILEYCERTEDWPDESKFRWTVEQFFSLDAFLRTHPPQEKVDQLVRYIQGGQIEVTALFGNEILEYCSHEELVRLMYPSFEFKRRHGIEITTAVHNDIPGCTWGLASVLARAGVKHLAVGIPAWYFGGSEATLWDQEACLSLKIPGAFWWEGPDGRRVLFWYNPWEPYLLDEASLSKRLQGWAEHGYPFDLVCLMIRGRTDNSPPSMAIAEAARQWNARWAYPRLITATQGQYLKIFEKRCGERLKTLRGDLPGTDYPACGTCAPRETALNRATTEQLLAAEKLRTAAGQSATEPVSEAYRELFFADEHCWGGTRPVGYWQDLCWNEKRAYTYRAALAARRSLALPVEAVTLPERGPHLVVFNPLSWQRTGVVRRTFGVVLPHEDACREVFESDKPFALVDAATGKTVPHQLTELSYFDEPEVARPGGPARELVFVAENLPAEGYKTYRLVPAQARRQGSDASQANTAQFANRFWKAEFRGDSGALVSLFDKDLKRELIDPAAPHGFGQVIVRESRTGSEHFAEWEGAQVAEAGPVLTRYRRQGRVRGLPGLCQETVFYHGVKRVDVNYRMVRDATPGLEIYVAFPFQVEDPRFRFEAPGSVIEPLADQLPGSNTDYYAVGHWVDVHNDRWGIVWAPHDGPMAEFGGLWPGAVSRAHHGWTYPGYGHPFLKPGQLKRSHVYSLVSYNNFTTNFLNVQPNEFRVRYSFGTHQGDWRAARAWQWGWGAIQQPPATWASGPQPGRLGATGSFYRLDRPNVILLTVKLAEDGRGHVARLFETEGRRTEVRFTTTAFDFRKAWQTSPTEEDGQPLPVTNGAARVTLDPFATATIRLQ